MSAGAAILYPLLYFLDESGWFAALLPGLTIHELGHWAAVTITGGKVSALRLDAAGLCMEYSGIFGRAEEAVCAAAGPAAGLLWAATAYLIPTVCGRKSAVASLLVNLFNLLPAAPLDGGRILFAATESRRALHISSAVVIIGLLCAAIRFGIAGFLIPSALLLRELIRS